MYPLGGGWGSTGQAADTRAEGEVGKSHHTYQSSHWLYYELYIHSNVQEFKTEIINKCSEVGFHMYAVSPWGNHNCQTSM